jgi:Transglutaminase-like superfamily
MPRALITKFRFRVALWWQARLLPFRVRRNCPLTKVLALASPPDRLRYAGLSPAYVLRQVRRATRHPLLMRDRRCLRQGILALRFMSAAGHRSELHFGIDRQSLAADLKAHCWLVHDGRAVLNAPSENIVPVLVHAGAGEAGLTPTTTAASSGLVCTG